MLYNRGINLHLCVCMKTTCADKGNVDREVEGSLTLVGNSTAGKDGVWTEKGRMRK